LRQRRISKKSRRKQFVAEAQRKLFRTLILFGLAILIIIFLFGDHGIYQLYKIKTQRKITQNRIEELKIERELLDNEKIRLETDLDYIERLAREKYRMAKKNEKVFKVIPRENK